MERTKIVIVGGGMVAGYAAKQLVELGLKSGDLAILSADTGALRAASFVEGLSGRKRHGREHPHQSGRFLSRARNRSQARLCEVSGVDPERKQLSLKSGGTSVSTSWSSRPAPAREFWTFPGQVLQMCAICDPSTIRRRFARSAECQARGRDRRRFHRHGSRGSARAEGRSTSRWCCVKTASGNNSSRRNCPRSLKITIQRAGCALLQVRGVKPNSRASEAVNGRRTRQTGRTLRATWWWRASE